MLEMGMTEHFQRRLNTGTLKISEKLIDFLFKQRMMTIKEYELWYDRHRENTVMYIPELSVDDTELSISINEDREGIVKAQHDKIIEQSVMEGLLTK